MSVSKNHHFIPQCLMKRWEHDDPDGVSRLYVHSALPSGDIILESRNKVTKSINFEPKLYSVSRDIPHHDFYERNHFSPVDSRLGTLLSKHCDDREKLSDKDNQELFYCLYSLKYRNPHHFKWLRAKCSAIMDGHADDEAKYIQLVATAGPIWHSNDWDFGILRNMQLHEILLALFLDVAIKDYIALQDPFKDTEFVHIRVSEDGPEFLLPDYPFFDSSNKDSSKKIYMCAISPKDLFVVCPPHGAKNIRKMSEKRITMLWNEQAVISTIRRIVSKSKKLHNFIERNWEGPLTFNDVAVRLPDGNLVSISELAAPPHCTIEDILSGTGSSDKIEEYPRSKLNNRNISHVEDVENLETDPFDFALSPMFGYDRSAKG